MAKFDSEHEELILKACDTLKLNGGLNIAKVAREFGVDYYALRRRFHGTGSSKSNPGATPRLNTVQDYALLQWIHGQFKNGFPLRKRHVTAAAYWLLEMDTQPGSPAPPPLSQHWYARWAKRHPEIHSITTTPLESVRKEASNSTLICEWFEKLRLCIQEYDDDDDDDDDDIDFRLFWTSRRVLRRAKL